MKNVTPIETFDYINRIMNDNPKKGLFSIVGKPAQLNDIVNTYEHWKNTTVYDYSEKSFPSLIDRTIGGEYPGSSGHRFDKANLLLFLLKREGTDKSKIFITNMQYNFRTLYDYQTLNAIWEEIADVKKAATLMQIAPKTMPHTLFFMMTEQVDFLLSRIAKDFYSRVTQIRLVDKVITIDDCQLYNSKKCDMCNPDRMNAADTYLFEQFPCMSDFCR